MLMSLRWSLQPEPLTAMAPAPSYLESTARHAETAEQALRRFLRERLQRVSG